MRKLSKKSHKLILVACIIAVTGWPGMNRTMLVSAPASENEAIAGLAADLCGKGDALKGKKLTVLYFQNLEGKEVPEGRRMAEKLMGELMKCGSFTFVERSGIGDLIKAQELELSGLVDDGGTPPSGAMLPADILISGTIAQQNPDGELTVKAADVRTGEIYAVSTARFSPQEKFSYKENEKNLSLYKKEPESLQKMNNTYQVLMYLSEKRPMLFLLAVTDENDPDLKNKPEVARRLKMVIRRAKKTKPEKQRKIQRLRKGVDLIRENDAEKYGELMAKKRAIIDSL